jgi:hypothetical protein
VDAPGSRGTVNTPEAVTVRAYCSCGHVVDEHANGGQCRANDDGERCTCQSVDVDEEA